MSERNSAQSGAKGERAAALFYRLRGYRILERNFRTRQGEIDLIVRKKGSLVFVEVKTRGENALAAPAESVTGAKQRRLILAAQRYIQLHPDQAELFMRFDVVEVFLPHRGIPRLHCIENAFSL